MVILRSLPYCFLFILLSFLAIQCTKTPQNGTEAAAHHAKLKKLNWLIGSWQAHDENGDFTSTYAWTLDKNFIRQTFTLTILNQKPITCEQLIGWDPVQKVIRSWTFDSTGGYGECIWNGDGKTWYVPMSYTLANGKRAAETLVLTYIDDATYTFSICNRDENGNILQDLGPYTNKRIAQEAR